MRKLMICLMVLCAVILLTVPAVLADGDAVRNVNPEQGTQITVLKRDTTPAAQTDGVYADGKIFHIERQVGTDNALYLVLIRSDSQWPPTDSSLYYINLLEAENGQLVCDAFPKENLDPGTYNIEITDYVHDGQFEKIGAFTYGNGSGDSNDTHDENDPVMGDLDNDGDVDTDDIGLIVNIVVSEKTRTAYELQVGDLDHDDDIDTDDVALLVNQYLGSLY